MFDLELIIVAAYMMVGVSIASAFLAQTWQAVDGLLGAVIGAAAFVGITTLWGPSVALGAIWSTYCLLVYGAISLRQRVERVIAQR